MDAELFLEEQAAKRAAAEAVPSLFGGSMSVVNEEEMGSIRAAAVEAGRFMKAPNGEPTNLTERQWLQVRTRAFKDWFGDWETVAKFRSVRDAIMSMPIVASLSGKEFQRDGVKLTDKVTAYWREEFGGKATSPEQGDVSLDIQGVKSSLGHGIGALKAAAFYAVPQVVQNGMVFNRSANWKNRGYDTAAHAAPISIAGKEYICEIVVEQRPNRQGFYLHEVEVKEKLGNVFKTSTEGGTRQASRSILARWNDKVNTIFENCSKVVDENGEPLVVCHGTREETKLHRHRIYTLELDTIEKLGGNLDDHFKEMLNPTPSGAILKKLKEKINTFFENSSKIVDENGEPLVVYHGTREEFSEFDIGMAGFYSKSDYAPVGLWFSGTRGFGRRFAGGFSETRKGSIEMSLFLNLRNPKIFEPDSNKGSRADLQAYSAASGGKNAPHPCG